MKTSVSKHWQCTCLIQRAKKTHWSSSWICTFVPSVWLWTTVLNIAWWVIRLCGNVSSFPHIFQQLSVEKCVVPRLYCWCYSRFPWATVTSLMAVLPHWVPVNEQCKPGARMNTFICSDVLDCGLVVCCKLIAALKLFVCLHSRWWVASESDTFFEEYVEECLFLVKHFKLCLQRCDPATGSGSSILPGTSYQTLCPTFQHVS